MDFLVSLREKNIDGNKLAEKRKILRFSEPSKNKYLEQSLCRFMNTLDNYWQNKIGCCGNRESKCSIHRMFYKNLHFANNNDAFELFHQFGKIFTFFD